MEEIVLIVVDALHHGAGGQLFHIRLIGERESGLLRLGMQPVYFQGHGVGQRCGVAAVTVSERNRGGRLVEALAAKGDGGRSLGAERAIHGQAVHILSLIHI